MTEEKSKLLSKLAKLKAAQEGEAKLGNEEAAQAFAAKLNDMLLQHELTMSDVEWAATHDDEMVELGADLEKHGIKRARVRCAWQEALASVVAEANMCQVIVRKGTNRVAFVGTRAHAAIAEYSFCVLARAADDLSRKAYNKKFYGLKNSGQDVAGARGYRASWLTAFVTRLYWRFREERLRAGSNAGAALVRLDTAALRAAAEAERRTGGRTANSGKLKAPNQAGRVDGTLAANEVELRKGLQQ